MRCFGNAMPGQWIAERMILGHWITLAVLALNSIHDIKQREIILSSVIPYGIFGIVFRIWFAASGIEGNDIGIAGMMLGGIPGIVFGWIPGIFLILLSVASKGNIGIGDGIMICAIGCWYEFMETVGILFLGLLLTIPCSLILWKCGCTNKELPFLPFLCGGWILIRIIA